jgi:ribonucleotide reductase alpha subunit
MLVCEDGVIVHEVIVDLQQHAREEGERHYGSAPESRLDFVAGYLQGSSMQEVPTMSDHIYVTTRNGAREPVSFDKVLKRIQSLAGNLDHVNPDLVAQKVCSQIADGIETSKLDEFAAETCAMMQARNHPNYGTLAARLVIDNHQKNTEERLFDVVFALHRDGIVSDAYYQTVAGNHFGRMIVPERDFMFDYFGFKTLLNGYLLRNNAGKVLERPQHLWMRVAIQLHGTDDERVRETYDALSQGYFIHATPTLFNSGTNHPQLSSCFLVQMESDSIQGIYNTLGECAQISKWAGGIGLSVHNIRARDSHIKGTNGKSTGVVPMLKVFNDTAKYVNQGGKRNGSFAIYMEPWHADIEEFLRLKLNTGAEEDRARDLFYGLWIPDLFMKRVEEDKAWSLMCPNECPGLADCWGEEFEALYTKYEAEGKARRQVPAKKIWQSILDAQIQTGTPYLCYKDAANRKSNQQNLGTIKSSNLCTEIIEYTSADETAVCNLGSLALPRFIKDGAFDFKALRHYTTILTRNLNKVIDMNFYPTEKCKRSNLRHRPIGIGVQGLADVFAKLRLPWTSPAATKLNREIFENIYYAAVAESVDCARAAGGAGDGEGEWHGIPIEAPRRGAYSSFEGSPAAAGQLQFDLWEQQPRETPYLEWAQLKETVARFGMRNSLLLAPMPTASTSQILGNNECIEPFTSNMYSRRVLAGEFVVINKYLVDDLVARNLWTADVRAQIIANNGSVQSIAELPSELRDLYRTAWEIPMKTLITLAADRAPFICQSQSLNLFVAEPSYSKLSSMHLYAWKQGLKTGCYYLRTKGAAKAQQFTVEPPACTTCSA